MTYNNAGLEYPQRTADSHEVTLAMLPHYTEMILMGRDVQHIYPLVARHLSHCSECMRVFEDLMMAASQQRPGALPVALSPAGDRELPFLRNKPAPETSVEFTLQPPQPQNAATQSLPWSLVAPQQRPLPEDAHLLLFEDTVLSGVPMQVLLFLHRSLTTISGEVFSPAAPGALQASLNLGNERYVTPVRPGGFTFAPPHLQFNDLWVFRLWLEA